MVCPARKFLCIVQDKRGFVWIGTEDGLNKFDGYGFTVYKRNSALRGSLVSNHITRFIYGIETITYGWVPSRGCSITTSGTIIFEYRPQSARIISKTESV